MSVLLLSPALAQAKTIRADSLAQAEAASRPGDTIVLRRAAGPFDGGIKLKDGQRLIGLGKPTVTNTTDRLKGDAVRLADDTVVRGLRIEGARRGAIYGRNVTRATVRGNVVRDHNTSCAPGFHIPPFTAPSLVGGVGVPIPDGLSNAWAAIQLDSVRGRTVAFVKRNRILGSDCGDGIDVRASRTARMRVRIARNLVRELREGAGFDSILAIGLQTRDTARMRATIAGNRQAGLGNDEDFGAGPSGADSEGVFINPTGRSRLRATVVRNTYTHTPGRGGFSANGLEYVSMGSGSRSRVDVRDSTFTGTPGDVLELLALGTDSRLHLTLDRVVAGDSTGFAESGFGDTLIIPGNNGDCLLAASGGARNRVVADVRRSTLTNCANNGVTVGSSVANGTGPTTSLRATIADSQITGNQGANLRIGNLSELGELRVEVAGTDLSNASAATSSPGNLVVEELGTTDSVLIDVSASCLDGGPLAATLIGYPVTARNVWWGDPAGPAPGRVVGTSRLDASDPLAAAPAYCPRL